MNIAMEQTEEYVNGQLKAKYGDAFIRGNNGAFLDAPPPPTLVTHQVPPHPVVLTSLACGTAPVLYISTQKRKA